MAGGQWRGHLRHPPVTVYGEGPATESAAVATGTGEVVEKKVRPLGPQDIRFTRSKDGAVLYTIVLGLPREPVRIRSLAGKQVASVRLLGSDEKLEWKQDPDALVIAPPSKFPCEHAITFSIMLRKP